MNQRDYSCEFCDATQSQVKKIVTMTRQRGGQWFIFEDVPVYKIPFMIYSVSASAWVGTSTQSVRVCNNVFSMIFITVGVLSLGNSYTIQLSS